MKQKLFCDMDSTITDSIKAFTDTYIDFYSFRQGYKEPNPDLVNDWSLKDQCGLIENPEDIFSDRLFFTYLKFFPNAKEVILELSQVYDITIVSIGTYLNISHKAAWINTYLPFIHNSILLVNEGCKMDKSLIRMEGGNDLPNIFIDDNQGNLFSQATTPNLIKYCFGIEKNWNKDWIKQGGRWLKDWNEVREELLNKVKEY